MGSLHRDGDWAKGTGGSDRRRTCRVKGMIFSSRHGGRGWNEVRYGLRTSHEASEDDSHTHLSTCLDPRVHDAGHPTTRTFLTRSVPVFLPDCPSHVPASSCPSRSPYLSRASSLRCLLPPVPRTRGVRAPGDDKETSSPVRGRVSLSGPSPDHP